jgi:uncharacterized protein YacL
MFLVLTGLGTVFPFVLSKVLSLTIPSGILPVISATLGICVAFLIYLMGFRNPFDKEERISDEWKALRAEAEGLLKKK